MYDEHTVKENRYDCGEIDKVFYPTMIQTISIEFA